MEELAQKEPEEKFRPDSHHTPLDATCRSYSPLTYSQERDLTAPESGADIVFASLALGLDHLNDAFQKLIPQGYEGQDGSVGIIELFPGLIRSPESLNDFVSRTLNKYTKAEQILCPCTLQGSPDTMRTVVAEAKHCLRHRTKTRRRWIKIIFVLAPPAVDNWFLIDIGERESIENRCDAVLSPKLWNEIGIRNRLDQLDSNSPRRYVEQFRRNRGWPFLLDHLFKTAEKENPSEPSEQLKRKTA